MAFFQLIQLSVTFMATQGGATEGHPTGDPTHALRKETDTTRDQLESYHRVKFTTGCG